MAEGVLPTWHDSRHLLIGRRQGELPEAAVARLLVEELHRAGGAIVAHPTAEADRSCLVALPRVGIGRPDRVRRQIRHEVRVLVGDETAGWVTTGCRGPGVALGPSAGAASAASGSAAPASARGLVQSPKRIGHDDAHVGRVAPLDADVERGVDPFDRISRFLAVRERGALEPPSGGMVGNPFDVALLREGVRQGLVARVGIRPAPLVVGQRCFQAGHRHVRRVVQLRAEPDARGVVLVALRLGSFDVVLEVRDIGLEVRDLFVVTAVLDVGGDSADGEREAEDHGRPDACAHVFRPPVVPFGSGTLSRKGACASLTGL